MVINDRLWRCAPQQLRRASEREHSEQILQQARPWTFENISKNLILGQYRNVAAEPYPDADAQDEEDPTNQGQEVPEDIDLDDEDMPPEEPPDLQIPAVRRLHSVKRKAETEPRRRYAKKLPPRRDDDRAASLAVEVGKTINQAFFSRLECPEKVIEIAFPILEDERHLRKYLKNPEAFVVTSLRKKRVEITEET